MVKTEIHEGNNTVPALLIAVWAIVLLVAFFANRGDDVGRIGSLFADLGGGPIVGSGIFSSLVGAVVAFIYQFTGPTPPAGMDDPVVPVVVTIIALGLLLYARAMRARGVLR